MMSLSIVYAHEKWFVKSMLPSSIKPLLFSSWNAINSSIVLLAIFVLVAALLIHFTIRPHVWTRRMRSILGRYSGFVPLVLRTLTGLLLFVASFSHFIFAPDLSTVYFPMSVANVLLSVQLLIGLGLILGIFPRLMSLFGLTLYILALFSFPFVSVLSYISFVGIFAYLFITGDPSLPKIRGGGFFPNLTSAAHITAAKPYAIAIMRFFVGFGFILVAVLYKLYEPYYALEFMRMHNVNFMMNMGFAHFSNDMFVFTAGVTEVLVGALIILGLLPRLVGAALLILFTITLSMFGIYELLGHLPLYAFAFAVLTCGGGERWSAELTKKR